MQKPSLDSHSSHHGAEPTADATQRPEQDPAGGIKLSGRNRVSQRARALAGLAMTSGLVATLVTTAGDTSSSLHHAFL